MEAKGKNGFFVVKGYTVVRTEPTEKKPEGEIFINVFSKTSFASPPLQIFGPPAEVRAFLNAVSKDFGEVAKGENSPTRITREITNNLGFTVANKQ